MNKCLSNLKNVQIPLADSFMEKQAQSRTPDSLLSCRSENTNAIHLFVCILINLLLCALHSRDDAVMRTNIMVRGRENTEKRPELLRRDALQSKGTRSEHL